MKEILKHQLCFVAVTFFKNSADVLLAQNNNEQRVAFSELRRENSDSIEELQHKDNVILVWLVIFTAVSLVYFLFKLVRFTQRCNKSSKGSKDDVEGSIETLISELSGRTAPDETIDVNFPGQSAQQVTSDRNDGRSF